jgi:hypothetical protein
MSSLSDFNRRIKAHDLVRLLYEAGLEPHRLIPIGGRPAGVAAEFAHEHVSTEPPKAAKPITLLTQSRKIIMISVHSSYRFHRAWHANFFNELEFFSPGRTANMIPNAVEWHAICRTLMPRL